jgi:hypothetical protein
MYMLIFRRIFLNNYWWQESDIWSQASYRYAILWEVILDPSDSYFLFADLVGFYTHWTYNKCMLNVYKNQQKRHTGSRNLMGPKTLPTIWGTYMKLVTKQDVVRYVVLRILFADHRGHDRMAVRFTSIFIQLLYIQISLPKIVAMIVWLLDLHLFSYNYYTFKSLYRPLWPWT